MFFPCSVNDMTVVYILETFSSGCGGHSGQLDPKIPIFLPTASRDSFSLSRVNSEKVENELELVNLSRSDLHSILTCRAENNNLSSPVSTSVKLDMTFEPLAVTILDKHQPLVAGKQHTVECQVLGARPAPTISWWLGTTSLKYSQIHKVGTDY